MSNNKKEIEQKQDKVMTKYDLKMQRRKEEKEKAKKEERRSTIIGIVTLVALVGFIAYFPIHTQMVIHNPYVTIGDEEVSKIEFDYRYSIVVNNYMNQYGSYASYFGLDFSKDLSTQMYSDTMTWKDFFEQMTVDNMVQGKAIRDKAKAEGFSYDVTKDYNNFEEAAKKAATEAGVSVKKYIRQLYGSYATLGRISDFVKEDMITTAYYAQIEEEKAPAEEEITAYYEENKNQYDSVDYRVTTIKAELSTEPTEDEIAKAMEEAKELADAALTKVVAEGQLMENVTQNAAVGIISSWLFDSSRKAGDTTVLEDNYNNQYYVLAFEKRYLDETPSADIRIILSDEKDAQAILDEWNSGAATEESFKELCAKYSKDASATDGGLYEGVLKGGVPAEVEAWLFDQTHTAGDTYAVTSEDGIYHYVVFYVGENSPAWKIGVKGTLLNEEMNVYLEEISADIAVSDPKGNLNYLKIEEQEEADVQSETVEGTEASQAQ